jgi:hypothetical protein
VSNVVEAITCRNRTRTDKEGALFVWHGGLIFHDGQASLARGGIEIIHRNFVVTAGEVGVWIYHAEAGAIAPGEVRVDRILSIVRSVVSDGYLCGQTIGGRTVGLHRFVGADEANPKEQARTKIAPRATKGIVAEDMRDYPCSVHRQRAELYTMHGWDTSRRHVCMRNVQGKTEISRSPGFGIGVGPSVKCGVRAASRVFRGGLALRSGAGTQSSRVRVRRSSHGG